MNVFGKMMDYFFFFCTVIASVKFRINYKVNMIIYALV